MDTLEDFYRLAIVTNNRIVYGDLETIETILCGDIQTLFISEAHTDMLSAAIKYCNVYDIPINIIPYDTENDIDFLTVFGGIGAILKNDK